MSARSLSLLLLPDTYAVARLEPDAPLPAWAKGGVFTSFTRTASELSVISPASQVPVDTMQETDFCCLRVQGPMSFSEVGVVSSLAEPLAAAGVSILVVATFDTDYLLVRRADLEPAVRALRAVGHRVRASPERVR